MGLEAEVESNQPNIRILFLRNGRGPTALPQQDDGVNSNEQISHDINCSLLNPPILRYFIQSICSDTWSAFLKRTLSKWMQTALLLEVTASPSCQPGMTSLAHQKHCHRPHEIKKWIILGQVTDDANPDQSVSLLQEDYQTLVWAVRRPHEFRRGRLLVGGKTYRVVFADARRSLTAIEMHPKMDQPPQGLTVCRLQRENNRESNKSHQITLDYLLLIGWHRINYDADQCSLAMFHLSDWIQSFLLEK
ncbi:hypothetical protein EG68_07495 [Paragonimus skrjabini miyazakii]|uniref:Uncharacterized protein n=1 Tax=Paragonimus skrjabini miyazakii TaxID=59628 RepID=A0A8S9YRS0_9TREM|nr:hypothetical protein EG68_07495 [Paragonimus skrjabini miyazakii]